MITDIVDYQVNN